MARRGCIVTLSRYAVLKIMVLGSMLSRMCDRNGPSKLDMQEAAVV